MNDKRLKPFKLDPRYREYVWGGTRLRPGKQTAEAWIVYEENRIATGPMEDQTLGQAAEEAGAELLGSNVLARTGSRFPLLIKLLDCADWLSVQVHPNNEQAVALEGPGHFGKTEAWHFLAADPGAAILCGFKPSAQPEAVRQSVRDGTILDYTQHVPLRSGDTIFIPAGTVHALGPGLLVYEVQQTSDITYRVFDWNRPASAGRKLHIEQSLAVLDPLAEGKPFPQPELADGESARLVTCPYFALELLATHDRPVRLDTRSESFHALTMIEGRAEAQGDGWQESLGTYETLIIPAATGVYEVAAGGQPARLLKSAVE